MSYQPPKLDAGSAQPNALRQHTREIAVAVGNAYQGRINVTPTGGTVSRPLPDLVAQFLVTSNDEQGLFPSGTQAAPGVGFVDHPGTGIRPALGGATVEVNVNGLIGAQIQAPPLAVNYPVLRGNVSGGGVYLAAWGADTAVGLVFEDKGGAGVIFSSNAATVLKASGPANAVNWIGVASAITGGTPTIYSWGDAAAPLAMEARGSGGLSLGSATNKIGFLGTTPVAKPAGVPVTAAGLHAALVSLGLIAP